jgi:lipopolysaccharide biosynthesis regulator YciM
MDNNKTVQLLEGIGYIIDNNISRAIVTFKNQILHGNSSPENYIILGKLYRQQKDLVRAIKIHENINSIENLDKKIRYFNMVELVHSYYDYGDYDKTIYYSNTLKNKNPEIYKIMADSYLHLKLYEKAINIYKRLEKQQNNIYSRYIAYCYFIEGEEAAPTNSSKILRVIKKGLKNYSRSRKGNMLLIDYYYKKNNTRDCIASIERFINEKIAKSDSDLHNLEKIYFDIDNIENFATMILKSQKNNEKDVFIALYLADYYVRKSRLDKALDILSNNIKLNGSKRLIVRKFAQLKSDDILKVLVDEYNYKCLKCDSLFSEYQDICNKCKSIETLKPY